MSILVTASLRELHFGNRLLTLETPVSGQGLLLACPQLVQAELLAVGQVIPSDVEMPCPVGYFVVCQSVSIERPIVRAFRDGLFEEAEASAEASALAVRARQQRRPHAFVAPEPHSVAVRAVG